MTATDIPAELHRAANAILSCCDGARTEDGHGYSKFDREFGESLAQGDPARWTPKQIAAAYKLMRKYRVQLVKMGIDIEAIPEPAAIEEQPKSDKPIDRDGILASLKWSNEEKVNTRAGERIVKSAPIPTEFWELWKQDGASLKAAGYSVGKYQGNWQITHWQTIEGAPQATQAARDPAANVPVPEIELPTEITTKLLSFQIPSVKRIAAALQTFGGAVDGSDLGSGKTYTALAVAKLLGLQPAIVCPKAVITTWHRAAAHIGVRLQFVVNYELARRGNTPMGKWTDITYKTRTGQERKREVFQWNVEPATLLIFDEAHKMKNGQSQNAAMGLGAIEQKIKVLAVSGTLAANPLEMRFLGELTGLHRGKDFWPWLLRNGCRKSRYGLEFVGGAPELAVIHRQIYPARGNRVRIADIPDFPECSTEAEAYDCNGNGKLIQQVYDEMYAEIAKLQARQDLSEAAKSGHILAVMTYARQRAELLKVPAICEMIEDYIENGRSVVVFTNFRETLEAILTRNKSTCHVQGGQKTEDRQKCIDDFQADRERLIVVNIQSGGAGLSLHDLNGFYPRVAIICPTWSAQDLKQATGRIHRAGGKSKAMQRIFYAAGTIEDKVCERVRVKIANINALNDGDLKPDNLF